MIHQVTAIGHPASVAHMAISFRLKDPEMDNINAPGANRCCAVRCGDIAMIRGGGCLCLKMVYITAYPLNGQRCNNDG